MKTAFIGALALAAVVAVPGFTFAATYAYVNTAGEVMTMEAATPNDAIMTAPSIAPTSGVILMDGDDMNMVGDSVSGV